MNPRPFSVNWEALIVSVDRFREHLNEQTRLRKARRNITKSYAPELGKPVNI